MEVQGETRNRRGPLIAAGVFLGLGLGGFVDGILLHQILQWHHMLSSVRSTETIAGIDQNMVWDGFFDAADWLLTVVGIALLWRAGNRNDVPWSLNTFIGSILIGAGAFNFFEGLIDHQILGIHHVKPGPNELIWDIGFLASGVILAVAGWLFLQAGKQVFRKAGGE